MLRHTNKCWNVTILRRGLAIHGSTCFVCLWSSCTIPRRGLILLYDHTERFGSVVLYQGEVWFCCMIPRRGLALLCYTKERFGSVVWSQGEVWFCCVIPRRGLALLYYTKERFGSVVWSQGEVWFCCIIPSRGLVLLCYTKEKYVCCWLRLTLKSNSAPRPSCDRPCRDLKICWCRFWPKIAWPFSLACNLVIKPSDRVVKGVNEPRRWRRIEQPRRFVSTCAAKYATSEAWLFEALAISKAMERFAWMGISLLQPFIACCIFSSKSHLPAITDNEDDLNLLTKMINCSLNGTVQIVLCSSTYYYTVNYLFSFHGQLFCIS